MNNLTKITNNNILMFDLDGTLIHTNLANNLAYIESIKLVLNHDYDLADFTNKRITRKTLKHIVPNLNQIEFEKIIIKKNKIYSNYLDKTKLNHITSQVIHKYYKTNNLILVTKSHKKRADSLLNYHGIIDLFNHKFYKEDIDKEKYTNKFKYVITQLKLSPSNVIVFENEDIEVDDAISSGIPAESIISI